MAKTIYHNGKLYFLDSIKDYNGFKSRLTALRTIHKRLKYTYRTIGTGRRTKFALYVRKWGEY